MSEGVLSKLTATGQVLGYAQFQRQWERGVLWLLGIICVAQFFTLLIPANFWYETITKGTLSALIEIFRSGTTGEKYFVASMAFNEVLIPLTSVLIVLLSFFMLLGIRWPRKTLILAGCSNVVFTVLLGLLVTVASCFEFHASVVSMGAESNSFFNIVMTRISTISLNSYPLVLLALILARNDGLRRGINAKAIWWVTAVACACMGAATTLEWVSDFKVKFYACDVRVFSVFLRDGKWETSLLAFSQFAGAMASLSAYAAIVWTIFKRRRGRAWLMICAALWIFSAVALHICQSAGLIQDYHDLLARGATSEEILGVFADAAGVGLRELSFTLAFALAVRMALSLSEVRDRLDGMSQESWEALKKLWQPEETA